MKSAIPWVLVAALLAGAYFLYSAGKDKDVQLAKLAQDSLELEKLRAENGELKKIPLQYEELLRLRKDHDELLRLRNDVQRMRDQAKQLTAQLAAAQAQLKQAQQAQLAQPQPAPPPENPASTNQTAPQNPQAAIEEARIVQQQINVCVSNLRQIDAAKQQWAMDNKKTADAVPTPQELAPYLANPGQIICPSGGFYSINAVGVLPTCSVATHSLLLQK